MKSQENHNVTARANTQLRAIVNKLLHGPSLVLLLTVALLAIIGAHLYAKSRAAPPFISVEVETGALITPANAITDTSASAGKAVSFQAATLTPPASPVPLGVSGDWTLKFDDEFNGTALDTSKWSPMEGGSMNNVTTHGSNVAVTGGNLVLTLASSNSGAEICTCNISNAYLLPVGGYTEARVYFPGNGASIYNWPAWWTSGPNWPAAGENDIAEGLGTLTENYHSPSGAHNHGTIPGTWSNAFHTYGIYRKAGSVDVYWDGAKVLTYATDDDGQAESLIVNVGYDSGSSTHVYGIGSQVKVDYVRAWQ